LSYAESERCSVFDEFDRNLIRLLQEDARAPASALARGLGANERTVRTRIDRLVHVGAIRLTAVIEPRAFGYGISIDVFLEVDPSREEAILARLAALPAVTHLAYGQSTGDLSLGARFRDTEEMHRFLRETLGSIQGLQVKGHVLVPRMLRSIYEWIPPAEAFAKAVLRPAAAQPPGAGRGNG